MKSIRTQIIFVIQFIVVVLALTLGVLSCMLNYATATSVLEPNMAAMARVAADNVSNKITIMKNQAIQAGMDAKLSDPAATPLELEQTVAQYAADFGFTRGNLLKLNGDSWLDGNNYAERDYFNVSKGGEAFISDPTVSKITGELSFLVSAPVWAEGRLGSSVVGVVYFVPDPDFLNKIMEELQPSANGYGYIINQNDISMADKDRSLVGQESVFELLKTDPALQDLANIEKKMISGESGFGYHTYEGERWVESYAPIDNTAGWSLAIMAPQRDFMDNFYRSIAVTAGVTLLFIFLGILLGVAYARRLTRPLRICVDRLVKLSNADLDTPVEASARKDELGVLQNTTKALVEWLRSVVSDIADILGRLAERDLTATSAMRYEGGFQPIQAATGRITDALNQAMTRLRDASVSVDTGSGQVSAGAQALSQGATEQASSVEELSATIAELADQVRRNAQNAQEARTQAEQSKTDVDESSRMMAQMTAAMDRMNEKSAEIGKIIKTIEDIAFQTNILSLNAAVEAARAGAAGKGFAVVADEVRNLAGKSGEAARGTTELIGETVRAVEYGAQIAAETAGAMSRVVERTGQVTRLIGQISGASEEQSEAIEQVNLAIGQISAVVQTNSATAEESAAASEELREQAQMLRELVEQFKLREHSLI